MKARINYTVVGLFVIILGAAMISIFVWLSVTSDQTEYKPYLIFFHDDVTGLVSQSDVRYNGVRVGYVKSVGLDDKNPQLVKVLVMLEQDVPILTSTVATLNSQGITGLIYVSLKATKTKAPLLTLQKGEVYPTIPSEPSLLLQLTTIVPELTSNLQSVAVNFNKFLSNDNLQAYSNSLKNIDILTTTLANSADEMNNLMQSLETISSNTAKASVNFPDTMSQLQTSLQSFDSLLDQLKETSRVANKTMKNGDLAITNFSSQVMPGTQQLVGKLTMLANDLQQISSQMDQDPAVLIRGRYPSKPGPGE